jgi:signal peptidase
MSNIGNRETGRTTALRIAKAIRRAASLLAVVTLLSALGLLAIPGLIGFRSLLVRTGSMTGTASVGSVVIAREVPVADIAVGDVILIQRSRDGRALPPVLHRVVERNVDEFLRIVVRTKGDANEAVDPQPYVLQGTTFTPTVIVPHVGYALAFVRTPVGWFGAVILPLLVGTALWIRALWRDDDEVDGPETSRPETSQPETSRPWTFEQLVEAA